MFTLRVFFLKLFSPFHAFVFRRTGGRVMGEFGLPVLLLTTTGARTGKRRTAPLLYVENGGALVVPASLWGGPRHPAWYHNLVANPLVEVETREGKRTLRARRRERSGSVCTTCSRRGSRTTRATRRRRRARFRWSCCGRWKRASRRAGGRRR